MRRPSFPTVISLIALFVALGGTSYAVIKLPAKSVGNRELKTNAVSGSKIRPGAVSRSDLASSARTGTRGPRGPAGPSGDAVAPEPWKALPFQGAWANYAGYTTGAYRKDARGRVYLRGLVTNNAPLAEGSVIATLPAGYRPTGRSLFVVGDTVGGWANRVDVLPTGDVLWISGGTAEVDFTSLETVSFWTD
jgi:hypothetical protein